MPELPEVEAHAERLDAAFAGAVFRTLVPFNFTVLKTASPTPQAASGEALLRVKRRGKFLVLVFPTVSFAIHLMQGGRLLVDPEPKPKPRNGQARLVFDDHPALLLTEAGKERRAGIWVVPTVGGEADLRATPIARLGPDVAALDRNGWKARLKATNMRLHGFLRDQGQVSGAGRMLANEICHRAGLSPFAMTAKLPAEAVERLYAAVHAVIGEALQVERARETMSSSAERPGRVHGRAGEMCPTCTRDTIRSVEYYGYTVAYCPTCQTGGKVLADNTTSKFLK